MSKPALIIAFIICLAAYSCAFAQGNPGDSLATVTTPGISGEVGSTLLRLGLALVLIMGLIYICVMMLRKLSYGKLGRQPLSGSIRIVDRNFISPKKQLCLVKIEKKVFLIGVTEQAVNLVADVSDQDFQSKQQPGKPEYTGFSFRRLFSDAKMNLHIFARHSENPQKS